MLNYHLRSVDLCDFWAKPNITMLLRSYRMNANARTTLTNVTGILEVIHARPIDPVYLPRQHAALQHTRTRHKRECMQTCTAHQVLAGKLLS